MRSGRPPFFFFYLVAPSPNLSLASSLYRLQKVLLRADFQNNDHSFSRAWEPLVDPSKSVQILTQLPDDSKAEAGSLRAISTVARLRVVPPPPPFSSCWREMFALSPLWQSTSISPLSLCVSFPSLLLVCLVALSESPSTPLSDSFFSGLVFRTLPFVLDHGISYRFVFFSLQLAWTQVPRRGYPVMELPPRVRCSNS